MSCDAPALLPRRKSPRAGKCSGGREPDCHNPEAVPTPGVAAETHPLHEAAQQRLDARAAERRAVARCQHVADPRNDIRHWATVNEFPDDTNTGKLLERMNRVKQFSAWCLNEGSGAPGAKSYDSIADVVPQPLGTIPQGVQRYDVEYRNYVLASAPPVKSYIPCGRYYPNPQALPFSNLQSFMVIHHYAWQ